MEPKNDQLEGTIQYHKRNREKEAKKQLISFGLMIALTAFSFFAVVSDVIPTSFALPFIVLLACLQVFLQLAFFMHMNHRGHDFPIWFMLSGIFAAILTVAGLLYLIWW